MIEVLGVSKTFGSQKALKNVSLTFQEGKTHVLLGSSGSGKSTLLRVIMGLIKPDAGQIKIDTHLLGPGRMGYVIQDGGLFPHLSVKKNVILAAKLQGKNKTEIESRFETLSALVGISSSLFDRKPSELSGGQKQRVALMRALMLDPAVLLLDEPLGALDPIIRYELQDQLKKIFNALKKTVLIVTHDIGEAAFFGHTVSLFNNGEVVQSGTMTDLIKNPADNFVSQFFNAQRPPAELEALI